MRAAAKLLYTGGHPGVQEFFFPLYLLPENHSALFDVGLNNIFARPTSQVKGAHRTSPGQQNINHIAL